MVGRKIGLERVNLENVHFVGLYCVIILHCTVQKTQKKDPVLQYVTAASIQMLHKIHYIQHTVGV